MPKRRPKEEQLIMFPLRLHPVALADLRHVASLRAKKQGRRVCVAETAREAVRIGLDRVRVAL